MVGENFNRIGISDSLILRHEFFGKVQLTFMGTTKVLHVEKGLARLAISIAGLVGRLVPHAFIAQIVVGLAIVSGVVARFSQVVGKHSQALRHGRQL
jgi:hypothetical protein